MVSSVGIAESQAPRPVSRGLKLQKVFIGIDSLYVVVEYPDRDVFNDWAAGVEDFHDVRLNEGIPYKDKVLRRGLVGYKLSVWDGDARLLITDRVNGALVGTAAEGQGMGLMLQLGPKWLRQYGDKSIKELVLNIYGQLALFGLPHPEKYPIRLNRLDIAIDIPHLAVANFSTDEWRVQWVGHASKMNFHTASRSRDLQGFSIGSSKGAVRFKVYDKVAESKTDNDLRFWYSVWGIEESEEIDVTRFEWSIKCYEAKFAQLQYLTDLSEKNLSRLLNYVVNKWGRLCILQEDTNQSRWPLTPLWAGLQELVAGWTITDELASREYDYHTDLSQPYLNSLVGWVAGAMVRVGLSTDESEPVTIGEVFDFLFSQGLDLSEITKRAGKKWKVASVLAGGH
ncbi:MAG: hypothetical protein KC415_03520 [Anaerolineales bacterium]|nr:hypothetical protein [Anaerolineales bacterium]